MMTSVLVILNRYVHQAVKWVHAKTCQQMLIALFIMAEDKMTQMSIDRWLDKLLEELWARVTDLCVITSAYKWQLKTWEKMSSVGNMNRVRKEIGWKWNPGEMTFILVKGSQWRRLRKNGQKSVGGECRGNQKNIIS